ncbi:putative TetR family regulatory protein [Actinacidiphila reveromycinica]|uniref:Putative TetR family regulatory protein n=1 Tax=Actinacidiphila reveromycinica TaxID=659352 RepID=A0A7U3VSK0_9ACTN|nr:TetR/AcrR family transcriptional regulator [Streptomyces sp. SN-593]BBB01961.1 putative TetR family regulatory protein [Streptomyces sp. SN-593]
MTEPPRDARERLIEGTRELLWERGYVGTSPTAIWRASGVGQGSMYHHFQGKPDLVLAAEQRSAEQMQRDIRACFAQEGSAYERISAYLLRERDALRGCPVGRLVADPEIAADGRLREPARETFAVLHECLVSALEDGRNAGEFAADLDAVRTASTLAAVVQGGYTLARAEASAEPYERAVQGALALLRLADR